MAWRRPSGRNGVLSPVGERRVATDPADRAGPPSAGVIGPRRSGLPPGRAVLGGLLIAAAAIVVFAGAVAATRGSSARYVVASRPLTAGEVIGPGDTAMQTFTLPPGTRSEAFRDGSTLIGRSLSVSVGSGDLIQADMLAPARSGSLRPVSITVDSSSLAGLSAGDPVDVLSAPVTAPDGSATGGSAGGGGDVQIVMRGASLMSVSRSGSPLAPAAGASTVVTLGVADLDEAERLVQAEHAGTVELVRAEPSDGAGPGPVPSG